MLSAIRCLMVGVQNMADDGLVVGLRSLGLAGQKKGAKKGGAKKGAKKSSQKVVWQGGVYVSFKNNDALTPYSRKLISLTKKIVKL
eukprot:g64430.t1